MLYIYYTFLSKKKTTYDDVSFFIYFPSMTSLFQVAGEKYTYGCRKKFQADSVSVTIENLSICISNNESDPIPVPIINLFLVNSIIAPGFSEFLSIILVLKILNRFW